MVPALILGRPGDQEKQSLLQDVNITPSSLVIYSDNASWWESGGRRHILTPQFSLMLGNRNSNPMEKRQGIPDWRWLTNYAGPRKFILKLCRQRYQTSWSHQRYQTKVPDGDKQSPGLEIFSQRRDDEKFHIPRWVGDKIRTASLTEKPKKTDEDQALPKERWRQRRPFLERRQRRTVSLHTLWTRRQRHAISFNVTMLDVRKSQDILPPAKENRGFAVNIPFTIEIKRPVVANTTKRWYQNGFIDLATLRWLLIFTHAIEKGNRV